MSRIRTIKPEFFRSETVSQLPLRTRLTWIGLWTECDDHGRARDNARLIKGAIWPLDNVSTKDIEIDLNTLADRRLIVRYEVAGKRYLAITNWDEHQSASHRRGEARHPGPDKGVVQENASRTTSDANRMTSRAGTGNREQGTGRPSSARADGERFDEFWAIYPRKIGKKAANRRWQSAIKDTDPSDIIAGAKRYADHIRVNKTEERFIAHPDTWLNQGRWDDQLNPQQHQTDVSPLWRGADL